MDLSQGIGVNAPSQNDSAMEPELLEPSKQPARSSGEPCLLAAALLALVAACATLTGAAALMWGSQASTLSGLDFNGAWFEDFLGPYWQTARLLLDGSAAPAPGYLYPSTLAWLLAPIAALTPPGNAIVPSIAALWWIFGSLTLWIGSLFALQRPRSLRIAALAGVGISLAHAPVHGAYWAQASLLAVGLLCAGVALISTGRPVRAGLAIGLGAALKLHPAIGVVALALPWRRGSSVRGLFSAAAAVLTFGVLVPMALMGRAAFEEFHRASFESLKNMHTWVLTQEGGRGAQDVPSVLRRALSIFPPLSSAVGWLLAGMLLLGASSVLRRSRASQGQAALIALIFLAAIPWAAVSPTWPHGLLWVPAAWWCALHCPSPIGRGFAALSMACGSIVALRIFGSPEAYALYGLPAWSAVLALAATVPAWRRAMGTSA